MKTTETMTTAEKRLLLFIECACVDYGGVYRSERINDEDRDMLNAWKALGLCDHGRVASEDCTETRKVWVSLSDEGRRMAAELRRERAERMWLNRDWITTEEKRRRLKEY